MAVIEVSAFTLSDWLQELVGLSRGKKALKRIHERTFATTA